MTVDGETVLMGRNNGWRPSHDMRRHLCLTTDIYQKAVVLCVFESRASSWSPGYATKSPPPSRARPRVDTKRQRCV